MKTTLRSATEDQTVLRYWRLSLALGLAVVGAVALLLEILLRTAERIEAGAAGIWTVGKTIANNTVHIALLVNTNQVVGQIAEAADGIAGATGRIRHAVTRDGKGEAAP